jgi:putative ABC transport system permease protein
VRGLYRLLLGLYPREFRRHNAEEMLRVFLERSREVRGRRGRRAELGFRLGSVRDVVVNALAERAHVLRRRGPGGGGGMEGWIRDLRYALRSLTRDRGFSALAVGTLALGIGANTAIFSVVRAVLLRPLPYEEPERLVSVWSRMDARNVTRFPHSPPDYDDLRRASESFEELAAAFAFPQALAPPDGDPVQVMTVGVTPNFFRALRVTPALGRDFVEADAEASGDSTPGIVNNVALLDHAAWRDRFGGDEGVLGQVVDVGGTPTEIVGVLPRDFRLLLPEDADVPPRADLWIAMRLDYAGALRNNVFLKVVGRLAPGVTLEQARAEVDRFAADQRARHEFWATSLYGLDVESLHAEVVAPVRPVLLALQAAVGLVLLIACANVSNLLLVRGGRRTREVAVRAAMGAGRVRILRQMMGEALLLAVAGGLAGVGVARLGIDLLLRLRPESLPRIDEVALDPTVLAFTGGVALVASLVAGAWPAVRGSRAHLADALKDRGRASELRSQRALRHGVIVAEVALSTVLLVGAALMVRTFLTLQRVEPGYQPEGALTFTVPVPFGRYPDAADREQLSRALHERMAALPGVEHAAGVFPLPLADVDFNGRWGLEDAESDPSAYRQAKYVAVTGGYFEAAGTRVVEGRAFSPAELADSARVVMVDRTLADKAFPGEPAVGRRILVRAAGPEPDWMEIVGVVEPQRHTSLTDGRETVFFTDRYLGSLGSSWILRTSADPGRLAPAVREAVRAIDGSLPVADVRPFRAYVDDALAPTRFSLVLLTVFGALAVVLASVGLYGVLAYAVGQRRAEIGVRMAFGAARSGILRMVLRQGLVLAGLGVALGLGASWGLGSVMQRLLVGSSRADAATFAGVAALFLLVSAAACAVPALRATLVDPTVALREE